MASLSCPVALCDACVLYPAPLRDLLIRLSMEGAFAARWTEVIHAEWTGSLLKKRPDLSPEKLRRTCDLMNAAVRDCLVTGYERHIPQLSMEDKNDRHVLAAAIEAKASVIVTFDKHFTEEALQRYGIRAERPDDFIADIFGKYPGTVLAAMRKQRTELNPAKALPQLLDTLLNTGLPKTVDLVDLHIRTGMDVDAATPDPTLPEES